MGNSSSKPGEPKSPRKLLLRRTNTQPGQSVLQKPVAPPATPLTNMSTARSSMEEQPGRLQSLSRQVSRVASRSGGLEFDPSVVSFLSKGTGRSNHEQSFRTRTPSPSPSARPLPETQTNECDRETLQVDQGVLQTGFIHSEVHESKTTVGRGAEAISFPKDPRPENTGQNQPWSEEGRPVNGAKAGNTDISAGNNRPPPSIFVSPPPLTSHAGVDSSNQPGTPASAALPLLQPFPHRRQRSVFKELDLILKSFLSSRTIGPSSLKPSASVRSLPAFAGTPPAVVQPIDPVGTSPLPSKRPRSQSLHRLSLSQLRDGLLSANGKSSKKLDAWDCTGRLRERTKTKFPGGFSDVSQAKLGDRVVAVKALRARDADPLDELRIRKRLAREIYVWAALDHPHVLEFLGFAFEDSRPCLVSPWCENGALHQYLQKYPGADRRLLVRQIAEGLKYLHTQTPPVIHGDFKTANVLVTDKHIPKICDFGSSKRVEEIQTGFATTNFLSTTYRYSAPEILREGEHDTLSLLTDVYAFACVALETMTDRCPFWKTQRDVAVIAQVLYEKQTPSQEDHPILEDPALWDLLRQCWKYEPSERPTMIEVCKMLGAAGYGPSGGFYLTMPEGATQPVIA